MGIFANLLKLQGALVAAEATFVNRAACWLSRFNLKRGARTFGPLRLPVQLVQEFFVGHRQIQSRFSQRR
ncbi:hypothetical protein OMCYN_01689 [cyanobiont of Ornithocercus magnificus]|nr:hypothetical protein OMCYN_01689 [cyanobiont of Ornithocercus magnificus]